MCDVLVALRDLFGIHIEGREHVAIKLGQAELVGHEAVEGCGDPAQEVARGSSEVDDVSFVVCHQRDVPVLSHLHRPWRIVTTCGKARLPTVGTACAARPPRVRVRQTELVADFVCIQAVPVLVAGEPCHPDVPVRVGSLPQVSSTIGIAHELGVALVQLAVRAAFQLPVGARGIAAVALLQQVPIGHAAPWWRGDDGVANCRAWHAQGRAHAHMRKEGHVHSCMRR